MADIKVSTKGAISTSNVATASFYCYVDTNSYNITRDVLLGIRKDTNQSASYSITIPTNAILKRIDFKQISGSPVIKVGTTNGASDLVGEINLGSPEVSLNEINYYCASANAAWVGITGGTVNVTSTIITSYL